jgi:hypothetical protein
MTEKSLKLDLTCWSSFQGLCSFDSPSCSETLDELNAHLEERHQVRERRAAILYAYPSTFESRVSTLFHDMVATQSGRSFWEVWILTTHF